MIPIQLVTLFVISVPILGDQINDNKFPDDFMFGVATASYQIEGGWNADGKGLSIWDTITHEKPDYIRNKDNGDIACDSYHKYKEDVQLLSSLNASHYRFSISWPRILPTGYANKINTAGVKYYRNLINELKSKNIEPLVTLYHWDLPQSIQDAGGWPNSNIIDWYTDYARVCFQLFGDQVKYWITFNEPISICHGGYGTAAGAPGIKSAEADYSCAHHLLLSHANVYHMYQEEFKDKQNGNIGIALFTNFYKPRSNDKEDLDAAETTLQFMFGWYANPLIFGDYPDVMKDHVARHSKAAGFNISVLPEFSQEMSEKIKGTLDYLGVNMYTSLMAKATDEVNSESVFWQDCIETVGYTLPSWKSSASSWLKLTPWGLGELVKWVSKTYNSIPIIITENGMSDNGTTLIDDLRIEQIQTYLSSLRDAMDDDSVKVFGYTHWSLMDNFEWRAGYTEKFGVTYVDFDSPDRTRVPKKSFDYYQKVIETKCLVDTCRDS